MKCPNCGALEKARVRVCPVCESMYASQDLMELRQLEYLLEKTAAWPGAESLRQPYIEQLGSLRSRLLRPEPAPPTVEKVPPQAAPKPVVQPTAQPEALASAPTAQTIVKPVPPAPAPAAVPKQPVKESLPFDQWLLSERNIKLALYSGGLLLVIAGLIFVSVNWRWLSGPVKFTVTLAITGLMFLGGFLLFRRPSFRLGGIALLAVACGFFPLNFAVLQIYIFEAIGVDNNLMWMVGSFLALLLYISVAYRTRADLFTYMSLAALASAATAGLVLLEPPPATFLLVYAFIAIALLLTARGLRSTTAADFTFLPLLITSQLATALIFISGFALWGASYIDSELGNPGSALSVIAMCAVFYLATDVIFGWILARWAAASIFGLTSILLLAELDVSQTVGNLILVVLAVAYQLLGHALQLNAKRINDGLPLYVVGYALAVFATIQAMLDFGTNPAILAQALLGDVLLLAVSAYLHRRYELIYGCAWLFLAPAMIYADVYLSGSTEVGIALGVLLLIYAAAGYWLGRRTISDSIPFLSAAAFLSLVVVFLVWSDPALASLVLGVLATLYLLAAIWLGFSWLLLPALAAVHLAVISISSIFLTPASPWQQTLTIAYAVLGMVLSLGCYWLQRRHRVRWGLPLLGFALLNLAVSYLSALFLGGWLAVGLSAAYALLALWLAWTEREMSGVSRFSPIFTYLGAALVFIGHFYLLASTELALIYWLSLTAGLCAAYIAVSWLARRNELQRVYGTPLHHSGAVLMLVPLLGAVVVSSPGLPDTFSAPGSMIGTANAALPVITYAIASAVFLADAAIRRSWLMSYLGGGVFAMLIWYALTPWVEGLTITYSVLGVALVVACYWLQRQDKILKAMPFLAFAVVDLAATYVSALIIGGWMAIGLSVAYALLALWLAWAEREMRSVSRLIPIFTYLGAALVFIGHFYLLALMELALIYWPAYTAGLCALLIALSWLARSDEPQRIYGIPLHFSGVLLMILPLLGVVMMSNRMLWEIISSPGDVFLLSNAILPLITYSMAGAIFLGDAAIRRSWIMGYLGGFSLVVLIWYALSYFGVDEWQAYIIPAGLGLLCLGWNEGRLGRRGTYFLATLSGLSVLLVSALYQSISTSLYAVLLLIECLLAIGWGIRTRSRIYVQAGGVALLVVAVAQLGPAFIELPRWVEIGIIGSLLLGGGLLALFRREQIVVARKNLSEEWKKWQL